MLAGLTKAEEVKHRSTYIWEGLRRSHYGLCEVEQPFRKSYLFINPLTPAISRDHLATRLPETMAAAVLQQAQPPLAFERALDVQIEKQAPKSIVARHDVVASLNYHKPNEDGSPPHPTYVDRPETYDRPFESHQVNVHDISGRELEYSLDGNGFQIHHQSATEKEFLDDDQIKASYYPEVEQLLKDVYVPHWPPPKCWRTGSNI